MEANREIPIDVVHLLPELDKKLIELLKSLQPEEWQMQTIAKLWKVKDVVAHLLDGNIRILSMLRDNYSGETADIKSYQDIVDYLNRLNADWVLAMKRVSPQMLILMHEITGQLFYEYYRSLDPFAISKFAVNWVGENESRNWMHIAREYTEKFLHQQQIRDAVSKPGLMMREYFYPFINIFMLALPYTFRNTHAENGTTLKVSISGNIGGDWLLTRSENSWELISGTKNKFASEVTIDPDISWKLFSKSVRPEEIKNKIIINGNQQLGETVLTMVSVMA